MRPFSLLFSSSSLFSASLFSYLGPLLRRLDLDPLVLGGELPKVLERGREILAAHLAVSSPFDFFD